uniref:Uncharacterized protein n=1 Tax=Oryza nivara TaxID=4536 RepID=A0A0E0HAY9_ORYNI
MASSHAIVAAILCLLLLQSSESLVQAARMMPAGDRPQAPVARTSSATDTAASSSSTSQDLLQEFMAPPRPISGKPEIIAVVDIAKRRRAIQVQGSVPSPGIGHH